MSEFQDEPAADGAADSQVPRGLAERRRAIKAALIAGPFVATLSGGRALAAVGSKIGCSMTGGCTSGTLLKTGTPEESSTSDEQTQNMFELPAQKRPDAHQKEQQQQSASEKVMNQATRWKLPETPRQ